MNIRTQITSKVNGLTCSQEKIIIFENQKIDNAYQIKINFEDIPISSRRVKEFLIRIPKNIELKWSDYKKATIEANNILYSGNVKIINNGKDIIVPISSEIPLDDKLTMFIGNLAFADIGSQSDEFNLKL